MGGRRRTTDDRRQTFRPNEWDKDDELEGRKQKAVGLFYAARQAVPDRRLVWAATGLNVAWVLASVIIVATG